MESLPQSIMAIRRMPLAGLFCIFTLSTFPTVVHSTPTLTPTSGRHIGFPCRGLHIKGKTLDEEADPSCGIWKKFLYDRQSCGINEAMCDCSKGASYKHKMECGPRDLYCCRGYLTGRQEMKALCIFTVYTGRWFRKSVTIKAYLCTPKYPYYKYPWLALISG